MSGSTARAVVEDFLTLADDSAVAILPHAMRLVAELGIAPLLAEGAMPVEDLARQTGCDAQALHRLLRALVSVGLFRQVRPRCYELTDLGQRLRPDAADSVYGTILNPESQRAWLSATHTIRTGEPAFATDFFGHKDVDPDSNRAFLRRMRERAGRLYPALASAADWAPSRVLLDIGGADGSLLARVLRDAPHLHGILFDRPSVIELVAADEKADEEAGERPRRPDELNARRTLCAGDFFEELPGGADTHLMCSVLHDWTDEQAALILSNSRRALADGGRLLIVEMVVPEDDDWHASKWSDLGMMVLTGGRERTADEFARLLRSAGYALDSVRAIAGSPLRLLQAGPVTSGAG